MSVPIPNYLKHLAVPGKQQKTWTHFSLKCPCGCERFLVYQNDLTQEEKALEQPYYEALDRLYGGTAKRAVTLDENGRQHYWLLLEPQKGLEGQKEEIIIPPRPYFSAIAVIRITCADCGQEHLLFDSRLHGYDGMTGEHSPQEMCYEPHFKLKCKDVVALQLKIENDESYEEFKENTDLGFTETQYSDAFGWIVIYKVDEKGKKTKIFELETA